MKNYSLNPIAPSGKDFETRNFKFYLAEQKYIKIEQKIKDL